jgi:hypothetical protein
MRLAACLLASALAAIASPPPECSPDYDLPVLDAEAVVEAEVSGAPEVPKAGDLRGRVRVAKVLEGAGVAEGDTVDVNIAVPVLYSCVGGGPTPEAEANHRANFVALFKPGDRRVFTLSRFPRQIQAAGAAPSAEWTATRTWEVDGPGRADLDVKLARRRGIAEIARLVVDLPQLEPYWHADREGRTPLVLVETSVIRRPLKLEKFGQAAKVWPGEVAANAKTPAFEISGITIDGDAARARFSYAVEGVVGEAELARVEGRWTVTKATVAEK